jgi:methylamine dehydrogenase heavy chain
MARPSCLILASLVAALAVPAQAIVAAEPLQAEVSDVATLKSPGPVHRFITNGGFGSSSFTFFDADSGKMEANISAGYISNLAIAPDQSRYYVSETYWTKGTRGAREDMVTVYDGKTLDVVGEITLPNRALAGKNTNFDISASGSKAYVYSMQPASSVFWLDLKKVALGGTVEIPGCALVYPFGDDGFSSLCGDGSLATVMIPASGTPKVTHSKPFFDANKDPIYENSIVDSRTGRAIFMSYTGLIYDAKLGAEPVVQKPWSIQQAAGLPAAGTSGTELAWRPGGRQLMALHKKTGKLFVIMHMGNYWTHKQGGTEIWVLDINKHSLISRFPLWPVPTSGKGNDRVPYYSSLAITQDEKPVLILLSPEGGDQILDPTTGEMIRKIESAGGGAALTPDL